MTEEEVEAVAEALDVCRGYTGWPEPTPAARKWARAAIKVLDEYRAAEASKRARTIAARFPKTLARLAESERNDVSAEPPAHKEDF